MNLVKENKKHLDFYLLPKAKVNYLVLAYISCSCTAN